MEDLRTRIENALRAVKIDGVENLLAYMGQQDGFYWVRSSDHDHWTGGTAEHSWRVYQYMLCLRDHPALIKDKKVDGSLLKRYLTDDSITLAGLLHDVGKMNGGYHHERKSVAVLRNLLNGPNETWYIQVLAAIFFHHSRNSNQDRQLNEHRDCLLRILLNHADSMASGSTWNAQRQLDGRTQHSGVVSSANYLRRLALDRTHQVLDYKVYLDAEMNLQMLKGYNRKCIKVIDSCDDFLLAESESGMSGSTLDYISSLHDTYAKYGKNCCLVLGIDPKPVADYTRRLRQGCGDYERDLLICSNVLSAFYVSKLDDGKKRHKYVFRMHDSILDLYKRLSSMKGCLYLPQVTFFRDGNSRGLQFVEPWTFDVVLVPGRKSSPYVKERNSKFL